MERLSFFVLGPATTTMRSNTVRRELSARPLSMLLIWIGALATPLAAQTTWHVAPGAPGSGNGSVGLPFASVQSALAVAAASGDEVRVAPGQYAERIDFLGKAVVVFAAAGPNTVELLGDGTGPIVTMVSAEGPGAVLRGVDVLGGVGAPTPSGATEGGGARLVGASARFERCTFRGNEATRGGGVYAQGGAPTFETCWFEQNRAGAGAGLYATGCTLLLVNCVITANDRPAALALSGPTGVGVYLSGALPGTELRGCVVRGNTSAPSPAPTGVGLYIEGAATLRDSTVSDNRSGSGGFGANESGGYGIGLQAVGPILVEDCLFENNARGFEGGAIRGTGVVARRCEFRFNAAGFGGAVEGGRYEDCVFERNNAGFDGVFWAVGGAGHGATLVRCRLVRNRCAPPFASYALGGGAAGECTLTDCELVGNDGGPRGGGLWSSNATGCLLRDNVAVSGGGAFDSVLTDCTLTGNRAASTGGACAGSGTALTRCIVFGNAAPVAAALEVGTASFCSIARNVAGPGSGAFDGGGGQLRNSIVWDNVPASFGTASANYAVAYSIVAGGHPGLGNLDADPLFLGPASGDLHLTAGSPAIDAADPMAPLDANGSRADMGALPFDPAYVFSTGAYCEGKLNSLGCLPVLSATGSPTLSGPDDFALVAEQLTSQSFALATVGTAATASPLAGGLVCVGALRARVGPLGTGGLPGAPPSCEGRVSLRLDQVLLGSLGAGTRGYAQVFFRDVAHPDGTGMAMTQGLEFLVQ
ncbi:MAG: right-handed parallel beta-helix repeat-containing protein [Planctomycetota bacterium]